jgi:hypothetical protein
MGLRVPGALTLPSQTRQSIPLAVRLRQRRSLDAQAAERCDELRCST